MAVRDRLLRTGLRRVNRSDRSAGQELEHAKKRLATATVLTMDFSQNRKHALDNEEYMVIVKEKWPHRVKSKHLIALKTPLGRNKEAKFGRFAPPQAAFTFSIIHFMSS